MIDYLILKKSYIAIIQMGLLANTRYNDIKHRNDVIHKFCENLIDNSNYSEHDKEVMKLELAVVKETLAQEIECHFKGV